MPDSKWKAVRASKAMGGHVTHYIEVFHAGDGRYHTVPGASRIRKA
jgi:hypothetical protein